MSNSPLATTAAVSEYTGISEQRLATMRMEGTGPSFIRLGARAIRYEWDAVNAWIKANTHTSTDEYSEQTATSNKKQSAVA